MNPKLIFLGLFFLLLALMAVIFQEFFDFNIVPKQNACSIGIVNPIQGCGNDLNKIVPQNASPKLIPQDINVGSDLN